MEEYRLSGEAMLQRANIREACSLIAKAFDTMSQVGGNEARVFEGLNNTSLVLEHVRYVHVAEPPQEAPMKCLECGGKGFIEHNAGLLQVKCAACHGTGQIADGDVLKVPESTTVFDQESLVEMDPPSTIHGPFEETGHADIIPGTGQPDKPARKPHSGKPKKPRKPPKGR